MSDLIHIDRDDCHAVCHISWLPIHAGIKCGCRRPALCLTLSVLGKPLCSSRVLKAGHLSLPMSLQAACLAASLALPGDDSPSWFGPCHSSSHATLESSCSSIIPHRSRAYQVGESATFLPCLHAKYLSWFSCAVSELSRQSHYGGGRSREAHRRARSHAEPAFTAGSTT